MVKNGYKLPASTEEWAEFDYIGSHGPWVSPKKYKQIENLKFYMKLAYSRKSGMAGPLKGLAKMRLRKGNYAFPLEKIIIEKLRPAKRLS